MCIWHTYAELKINTCRQCCILDRPEPRNERPSDRFYNNIRVESLPQLLGIPKQDTCYLQKGVISLAMTE